MRKLEIFEISLANMSGVFYAGNVVEGYVTIGLNEPMKMKGIKLTFKGKARVDWTETESSGTGSDSTTNTRSYSAKEEYFDQDVRLYGPEQGKDSTELNAGRHTFPFQFHLPMGLPSSFEGSCGNVRYTIKCKISKPWKFDHKTKRAFTVISILDLNQQPQYSKRVQGQNSKTLCCLCCASGPIQASFHIGRQGWVPGEAIKLFAEISNGTSRKMDKSYVSLKMITTFHATTDTKTESKEVARVIRPSIEAHGDDVWNGEELIIPPLPPSFLVGCKIIDIRYIVQLNVDPSGPALDLEVPLEIVIGTIPLVSVVQQCPPMPSPALPSAPMFPPAPDAFPHMPPPSYSACITGQVSIKGKNDEHTRGNLQYAPMYTYYNWGHTPGPMPPKTGNN